MYIKEHFVYIYHNQNNGSYRIILIVTFCSFYFLEGNPKIKRLARLHLFSKVLTIFNITFVWSAIALIQST